MAGDAESVLKTALCWSVLYQHHSERATGEHFSLRSVDKTSVLENRFVLRLAEVISGEVI